MKAHDFRTEFKKAEKQRQSSTARVMPAVFTCPKPCKHRSTKVTHHTSHDVRWSVEIVVSRGSYMQGLEVPRRRSGLFLRAESIRYLATLDLETRYLQASVARSRRVIYESIHVQPKSGVSQMFWLRVFESATTPDRDRESRRMCSDIVAVMQCFGRPHTEH